MKITRQAKILELISQKDIETQEELVDELRRLGMDITQATVSRDIKVLDLVKTLTEGDKYKYSQRLEYNAKKNSIKFKAVFIEAVISVDYAINTVVIKCHVGMANAACAALDAMLMNDVVGTIAGDDTIFILLRTEEAARNFVDKINGMLEK